MADTLRFTILGCGSSPGVPRITGDWGACDPANPKNKRLRASLLVERIRENGDKTVVVIDTGPDFRQQMINAQVKRIDAVVYTHAHADHIHGIDDLRGFWLEQKRRIDIYADVDTSERLRQGFGYCFDTPPSSYYPPIVTEHRIHHHIPFVIDGSGGPIEVEPLPQQHGAIISLSFRIGSLAYCSDVSDFPDKTAERLKGLEVLIIDALQYNSHPTHISLEQSLAWIKKLKPQRAIFTHMHTPLDYERVNAETPEHVEAGYDGMALVLPTSTRLVP
jgi:phosphoribosyl 1,2-cyclic phosphate phosphodiesterase